MCIGGPALIYYVTPTEEELFLVCYNLPVGAIQTLTPFTAIQPRATATLIGEPPAEARELRGVCGPIEAILEE